MTNFWKKVYRAAHDYKKAFPKETWKNHHKFILLNCIAKAVRKAS